MNKNTPSLEFRNPHETQAALPLPEGFLRGKGEEVMRRFGAHSPYLSKLLKRYPEIFFSCGTLGLEETLHRVMRDLSESAPWQGTTAALMQSLREAKAKLALIVAAGDISGEWSLEKVTRSLAEFADLCLQLACRHLLHVAHQRGEILLPHPTAPERESGLIILGMGKLGAHELNYSSDIDLIILFDSDKVQALADRNLQSFFSKLAQELVRIMQERTEHGYVFRTDLRLRPDPASTPSAMSTNAALTYYETVGQNWERAALIKARTVAGDMESGQQFMKRLAPFIWRKHLDFAAIADIQSIKRQMDTRGAREILIPGHNIKIGLGGIREIEFFVQIHQLIWGGRMPGLRSSSTVGMLQLLAQQQLITEEVRETLTEGYGFLRMIEHRLQMMDDEQTHTIPALEEKRTHLALFSGFESLVAFESALQQWLQRIHEIYAQSFQGKQALGDEGILVFTGVEADPGTINTIAGMGFREAKTIAEIIQAWHRGSRRATRTKRARELITELTPAVLKSLAATANPDEAFLRFDAFLSRLPAGVQIFSLFSQNPHLLEIVATIMGNAPALAEKLSHNPNLLDVVLTTQYYGSLQENMEQLGAIAHAEHFEEALLLLRKFNNEKQFQVGVQLLKRQITPRISEIYLSSLAENVLKALLLHVEREFLKLYGVIPGAQFAIIALGKLGAREVTFHSDLDLVFVYDAPQMDQRSDGERGFTAPIYYNRLVQRFVNAMTTLEREGRLYEVDTRLRPSGKDGPLAVSFEGFEKYFSESAWTFELMALTRARVVAGHGDLKRKLDQSILRHISRPREETRLRADINEMRRKVESEFGTQNPWRIKYVRGGMMDLDFIGQYQVLRHAASHPAIIQSGTARIIPALLREGLISADTAAELSQAADFLSGMLSLLRLCSSDLAEEIEMSQGLRSLLVDYFQEKDFNALRRRLQDTEAAVLRYFSEWIAPPV